MRANSLRGAFVIADALVRCAALRISAGQRMEWSAEWLAELWYVHDAAAALPGSSWNASYKLLAFSMGAFQDAKCVRALDHPDEAQRVPASRSALSCIFWLASMAVLAFGIALLSPNTRGILERPPYADPQNTVMIAREGFRTSEVPLVRMEAYRAWKELHQHVFADFAFFQPVVKRVYLGRDNSPELAINRASSNIFRILGVPVHYGRPSIHGLPILVLTESAWHKHFGGNLHDIGATVKVGRQEAIVGGVVSDRVQPASSRAEAWLLLPGPAERELGGSTRVFALARLFPSQGGGGGAWLTWTPDLADSATIRFDCFALSDVRSEAWGIFVFTVIVALLSLPATTSLPLGEYPAHRPQLRPGAVVRRWAFFAAKIALAIPAVCFGSIDAAYLHRWSNPYTGQYLQLTLCYAATLLVLRWALRDQRQRCPVCLAKLTSPAKVGHPSRNFLSWSGTELICAGGHGLLHVPELPTSWFSTQRWVSLDASWSGLFLRPV